LECDPAPVQAARSPDGVSVGPAAAAGVAGWAMLAISPHGDVVRAHDQIQQVTGYDVTDLVGRHLSYLYPDRSGPGLASALDRAERHGSSHDEGWRVREDGSWFWASSVILRELHPDGSVAGFCVLIADLTMSHNYQAQQRAVEDVTEAVRNGLGRDAVLARVARNTRELLGVSACAVLTLEAGDDLLVRATSGPLIGDLLGSRVAGHGSAEAEAMRTQRSVTIRGGTTLDRHAAQPPVLAGRSALLVPVTGWGGSVGLIEASDDGDRRFTDDDARAAGLLAVQVGIEIDRTRAAEAIERLGAVIAPRALPLPAALDALTTCVVQISGAAAAALYVVGDDGSLRLMAREGEPVSRPGTIREVASAAALEAAHASGSTIIEPGLVCVPLLSRNDSVGVLRCHWPGQDRPGALELAYVSLVAAQAAVVVDSYQRREGVAEKAALKERHRLARELHDSVSQALYSIGLGARTVRELLDRDPGFAHRPVDDIVELAEAGLTELHALIFELRPEGLAEGGLVAALEKQIAAMAARYDLDAEAMLGPEPAVAADVKRALYRIAREALQNVARHARARRVVVSLDSGPTDLVLEISDDGMGFDPTALFPGHFGLASMRERISDIGGDLDISSSPGTGTRVRARARLYRGVGVTTDPF
jgi:PAS domain S-box-containing protein